MVSVIITAYNGADTLAAAIDSALAQSYRDFEVLVVDDGSTDGTAEVLAGYEGRVVAVEEGNSGVAAAGYGAIRAARGEFLAFLDADDTWMPEKLERQMPRFADPAVGLVYSDYVTRYADGSERASFLVTAPLACEGDVLESYVQSRFLLPSMVIVRRECVEELGGFDESFRTSEDVELFGRSFA